MPDYPLILFIKADRVLLFYFVFLKEFMTTLHKVTYFCFDMNSSCIYFVSILYF